MIDFVILYHSLAKDLPDTLSASIADSEDEFCRRLIEHPEAIGIVAINRRHDGRALAYRIRAAKCQNMLLGMTHSTRADHTWVAAFLNAGGDQVLSRSAGEEEFFAVTDSLFRRGNGAASPIIEFSGFRFDRLTRDLSYLGEPIRLTPTQARILDCIIAANGKIVSGGEIIETICAKMEMSENTVSVHLGHARSRIAAASGLDFIMSKWGMGYYFLPTAFKRRKAPFLRHGKIHRQSLNNVEKTMIEAAE